MHSVSVSFRSVRQSGESPGRLAGLVLHIHGHLALDHFEATLFLVGVSLGQFGNTLGVFGITLGVFGVTLGYVGVALGDFSVTLDDFGVNSGHFGVT